MAHDVSEFLTFVSSSKRPDQRAIIYMTLAMVAIMYPVSYMFTKYHYLNCHSYRFEVYAVKNGGYKKFREKAFKTHKTPGNWLGQYS